MLDNVEKRFETDIHTYMLLLLQVRKPKLTKGCSADYDDSDSNVMGYKPTELGSLLPSYSSF